MSRGKRPKDEILLKDFAMRFKKLVGNLSFKKIGEKLDNIVSIQTLYGYLHGLSLPSPPVLLKISEKFNVTIDWLLKGEQSPIPCNDREKEFLYRFREAEELMVADKIESYCNYLIEKAKKLRKK